ncbi:MAG TPA: secondary thiamine-phosphate synthase enzyme YjbQ [Verrucomicrobiota bacterium]|nr:secondary thiamine-phosphate synthase enzyme YjbQ [Verrucomicrobiota bacterium]
MFQRFYEITVKTKGRGLYEFTHQLNVLVNQSGLKNGIVTLNIQHTSASLVIQENADPDVRGDLERFFQTLIPDESPIYQHTIEGSDDMSAHIRTALTQTSISIILKDGKLALGTWQGIYLWEHRTIPHNRCIIINILGE